MTLRLVRPLAWAWLAVAVVDLAVAGAYLASGYWIAMLAAIAMIGLAITSIWTAIILATASTERPLLVSLGWAWARLALMAAGFAAVIGARLGL